MLDRAPVAAEQRVGADEIDGPRDPAVVAAGHHQQRIVSHGLADQRKERAGQIRTSPFARTGFHVEGEERIPGVFGDVAASQGVDRDSSSDGLTALALDRLAMARVERGKEIVKAAKTVIVPVKLLIGALQEAVLGQKLPFRFARERHMHR